MSQIVSEMSQKMRNHELPAHDLPARPIYRAKMMAIEQTLEAVLLK